MKPNKKSNLFFKQLKTVEQRVKGGRVTINLVLLILIVKFVIKLFSLLNFFTVDDHCWAAGGEP
jgi:hypothetical protein